MSGWTGRGIVTLLSDFGSASSYPGSLRGALLSASGGLTLADLTHDVPPFDVMAGALILRAAVPAFPSGTVHLAVVDPGVGGARRPIAVRRGGQAFVGPDNGLFHPFLDEGAVAVHLDAERIAPGPVAPTFHGRDLFAPAAALIAHGEDPERLGSRVDDPVRLDWPEPRTEGEDLAGVILAADAFGNLITNIDAARLGARTRVRVGGVVVDRRRTYADVPAGTLVALVGSGGLLEVAESRGSAAARLGARAGDPVRAFS